MTYLIGTVVYVLIGCLFTYAGWRTIGYVGEKGKRSELVIDLTILVLLWPLWFQGACYTTDLAEISFTRLCHKMYKRMWGES
jgi:hypothetical protein